MITNSHRDTTAMKAGRPAEEQVDLAGFDGQRIAVVLDHDNEKIVLRGTAQFSRDDTIGNVLNIHLDDEEPGRPVLVISEAEWNGRIIPDFHYGCQFCLIVN